MPGSTPLRIHSTAGGTFGAEAFRPYRCPRPRTRVVHLGKGVFACVDLFEDAS